MFRFHRSELKISYGNFLGHSDRIRALKRARGKSEHWRPFAEVYAAQVPKPWSLAALAGFGTWSLRIQNRRLRGRPFFFFGIWAIFES